jgi:hypothetical protein
VTSTPPNGTAQKKEAPIRLLRCAQSLRAGSRLEIRPGAPDEFAALGMTKFYSAASAAPDY